MQMMLKGATCEESSPECVVTAQFQRDVALHPCPLHPGLRTPHSVSTEGQES